MRRAAFAAVPRGALRCLWHQAFLFLLLFAANAWSDEEHYFSYTIGAAGNRSEVALKGEIGTGTAQPGGGYAYSIPIDVPAGPRGVKPSLVITYSGEGNGWVGKGWSFGFGSVTRDTRAGVPQDLQNVTAGKFLLNGMAVTVQVPPWRVGNFEGRQTDT